MVRMDGNRGKAFYLKRQPDKAQEALDKTSLSPGYPPWVDQEIRDLSMILCSQIDPDALNYTDKVEIVQSGFPSPGEITTEYRIFRRDFAERDEIRHKYLAKESSGRDDTLSILRGWSSAVTLLEGSERLWRGGGYFLKWHGKGIVIDPGLDFLRNLHDANYHAREIDAVLVSHNHPDHNADLLAWTTCVMNFTNVVKSELTVLSILTL